MAKRLSPKERTAAARMIAQRMPLTVLCEMLGTSRKVVGEWVAAGLRRNPDGTYNLFVVLPWLRERWSEARQPGPAEEEWITRKRRAEALMKELDLGVRNDELLPLATVEERETRQIQVLKDGLTILAKRATREAGKDAGRVVREEIRMLLKELGGGSNGQGTRRRTAAQKGA